MGDDRDDLRVSDGPGSAREDAPAGAEHRREDEASCLGCVWLVIVPLIVLGVAVVTLNWLGC